jgi:hypothetical protein
MLSASMESHITDPPILSVVGGALMDDCIVDEPAPVALPCSLSHDSALPDVAVPPPHFLVSQSLILKILKVPSPSVSLIVLLMFELTLWLPVAMLGLLFCLDAVVTVEQDANKQWGAAVSSDDPPEGEHKSGPTKKK